MPDESGKPSSPPPAPVAKPPVRGSDQPKGDDLEFVNDGEVIDVWSDDPEGQQLHDALVRDFGGQGGYDQAAQDLSEAVALLDPNGEIGSALEGVPRSEESGAIRAMVQEWREILANPEAALAKVQQIINNVDKKGPWRSFLVDGQGSEAMREAWSKLQQASCGEEPVGRQIPRSGEQVFTINASSTRRQG